MNWIGTKQAKRPSNNEYDNAPYWKLVNDFTIHENEKLNSGRSFARNCLPKRLIVKLTKVEVINDLDWQGQWSSGEDRSRGFEGKTRIEFDAILEDRITVFTMEKGAIETFTELKDATIYPSKEGEVGGNRNASSYDGILLTAAQDIPADGLMAGEPGVLTYIEAYENKSSSLDLSLPLDEPAFERLANKLTNSVGRPGSIHLSVLGELFEGEVSAALNDPRWGFGSDYGLLLRPKGIQYAKARLDSITVVDQEQSLVDRESWPDARRRMPVAGYDCRKTGALRETNA